MTLFSLLFTCWTVGPLLLKRSASIFSSVMKLAGAFLSTRAIRMGLGGNLGAVVGPFAMVAYDF